MIRLLWVRRLGFHCPLRAADVRGIECKSFGLIEVSDLGSRTGTTADGSFTLTLAASPKEGSPRSPSMSTRRDRLDAALNSDMFDHIQREGRP